jgi:N-acyl-D-amino-acid deacylase
MNHQKYDLVLSKGNVLVFDPDTVLKGYNIGISNGKILKISKGKLIGRKEINVEDKLVSPGFIDFHSHVDGKPFSAECLLRQGATTTIGGERNFDGLAIRRIEEDGFIINHGFYISHSFTLRKAVGIEDPYKAASQEEIEEMGILAEEFMKDGAFGVHFGLEFVPGTSETEILALARIAKKYDRIILVHVRNDGLRAMETFDEVFYACRETGCKAHILHLLYMVGFRDIMDIALEHIDTALGEGLDVTADTGLYGGYPTCIGSSLLDGDWTKKYGDSTTLKNLVISSGIYSKMECNQEMFEFLREEYPNTLVTILVLEEEEIPRALVKPYMFVSTNAADGPHYDDIGHPETTGTFPKLIREYVLDKHVLSLESAIKKITCMPADRLGIKEKGRLKEGYDADIVVLDLNSLRPCSDYIHLGNPNEAPLGVETVIVNGGIAMHNNAVKSDSKFGKMLRHKTKIIHS